MLRKLDIRKTWNGDSMLCQVKEKSSLLSWEGIKKNQINESPFHVIQFSCSEDMQNNIK